MDYKKGICVAYLKRQFDARMTRAEAESYDFTGIPARFASLCQPLNLNQTLALTISVPLPLLVGFEVNIQGS